MKNNRILVLALAVVGTLILASGVRAQSLTPVQEQASIQVGTTKPDSVLSIATHVSEAISYQGVLEENGTPVTGSRDMSFSLYADEDCIFYISGIVEVNNVPVEEGLFNVQLDFDHSYFTGQRLFLEVEVEGNAIGCLEILPVPYALSLRPGAEIATESTEDYAVALTGVVSSTNPGIFSAGVRGINNGTGGSGIGVYGSQAGWGWGVYGQVNGSGKGVVGIANGETGIGVWGLANGANGVGVYAQGSGSPTGTALMLNNGNIRVNGAGLGTSTPVFIHQATADNIACGFDQCTVIDHPLTNGDPNAILIVTHNFTPAGGSGANDQNPVGVQYLSTSSKWAIYHINLTPMLEGTAFNILVVKP